MRPLIGTDMTRRMASFLLFAALVSGCGRSQPAQRKDQNYQVVQEGQASGVTSTINGPGEATPPMTNTGVDTTTNLTLLDNPAPLGTQGTSNVAGTLPQATTTAPAAPRTAPTSTPPPMISATPSAPTTTDTVGSSQPQPRHRPRPPQSPPQTDTTATQAPPRTDTTATQAPPPTDTSKTDTTKTDTGQKTDSTKTDTTKTDTQPPPPV